MSHAPDPRIAERNSTVLDLWAAGTKSRIIGLKMHINETLVRTIIRNARLVGDPRATKRTINRNNGDTVSLPIVISNFASEALQFEARRRHISARKLASDLLEIIAQDSLFRAVIDDDSEPERMVA